MFVYYSTAVKNTHFAPVACQCMLSNCDESICNLVLKQLLVASLQDCLSDFALQPQEIA